MSILFQKKITDEDVVNIIQKLYRLDNDGIRRYMRGAQDAAQEIKNNRLSGKFSEKASPSLEEHRAQIISTIGNEMIFQRRDETDFNPILHYVPELATK